MFQYHYGFASLSLPMFRVLIRHRYWAFHQAAGFQHEENVSMLGLGLPLCRFSKISKQIRFPLSHLSLNTYFVFLSVLTTPPKKDFTT